MNKIIHIGIWMGKIIADKSQILKYNNNNKYNNMLIEVIVQYPMQFSGPPSSGVATRGYVPPPPRKYVTPI